MPYVNVIWACKFFINHFSSVAIKGEQYNKIFKYKTLLNCNFNTEFTENRIELKKSFFCDKNENSHVIVLF